MSSLVVALCRGGFEVEAEGDLARTAGAAGRGGALAAVERGRAWVVAPLATDPSGFERALAARPPVFVRSSFVGRGPVALTPSDEPAGRGARPDRLSPILAALEALAAEPFHRPPWASVWLEHPDNDEGKGLSTLCRALEGRLEAALSARGWTGPAGRRRAHVLLLDGATAFVGTSSVERGSPWPGGVPRLRMPEGAPSRSARKLVEAFATFLGEDETSLLRPGLRAVDLGAAPGGWTLVLAERGVRVTAVDNGPLKGPVARDPLVTHLRADGLTYRPRKPVDWLVCDIVLQPSRVARLVARWIGEGWARRAIFNLKLPMKKRHAEVERCEGMILEALAAAKVRATLSLRHLYHDREEVTGYLARSR